jgi:hypothetical protein
MLPLFIGGDLGAAKAASVRAHLRDCSACRQQASGLLQSRRALQSHARAVAKELVDDVQFSAWHGQILAAIAAVPAVPVRRSFWRSPLRRRALAAAACAMLLGGYFGALPAAGLFERAPIEARGGGDLGSRFLQPLGQERWLSASTGGDAAAASFAQGLMGRLSLRTLDDESVPLLLDESMPPVRPKPASWVGTEAR